MLTCDYDATKLAGTFLRDNYGVEVLLDTRNGGEGRLSLEVGFRDHPWQAPGNV